MRLHLRTRPDRHPLPGHAGLYGPRRGFTLVELLVVITIILITSILVLPPIVGAINHRQGANGAQVLQAALAGARDQAAQDNAPAGIRLLPDPVFPITRLVNGAIDPAEPMCPICGQKVKVVW